MDVYMKKISKSEFIIMDIIWNSTTSLNRHEIANIILNDLKKDNWQLATISTFISRLCDKDIITYEKRNKFYCYYPKITKKEYIQSTINEGLVETFKQNIEELILAYTCNDINDGNIKKVKHLLENLENNTTN